MKIMKILEIHVGIMNIQKMLEVHMIIKEKNKIKKSM